MPSFKPLTLDRLLLSIDVRGEDDCWEWLLSCGRKGYAQVMHIGRLYRVHRLVWQFMNGPIPDATPFVLHTCDNRRCCNYKRHLFLGTNRDNVRDMIAKGRNSPPPRLCGLDNGMGKLSDAERELIKSSYPGASQRVLAARFRVSQRLVWNILHS